MRRLLGLLHTWLWLCDAVIAVRKLICRGNTCGKGVGQVCVKRLSSGCAKKCGLALHDPH